MTDLVEASVQLAGTIRDYWESKFAPRYRSADLREQERRELIELRRHLQEQDFGSAQPILEKWRRYHQFNGDFADTLADGFRHLGLAELCQELLDLLAGN